MTDVSNDADLIDTRDVLDRINELEGDLESFYQDGPDTWDSEDPDVIEIRQLQDLINEVAGYSEDKPADGVTLIRATYFVRYMEEYFEDTSDTPVKSHDWPFRHIDWEAAADELRVDYTEVEYNGVSYLFR